MSKLRSFEKKTIFDLLFTFSATREKLQKFLQHKSHSNTYVTPYSKRYALGD